MAVAPLLSVPNAQVTTPASWAQVPCEEIADTKLTLAGKALDSITLAAGSGPLFVRHIV